MGLPQTCFEETYVVMVRVARKRSGDVGLAHESAAERWIEVRKTKEEPPGSIEEAAAYCLRYCCRRGLDGLRKQARGRRKLEPWSDQPDRSVDQTRTEIRAFLEVQRACLTRLPARRQELLDLYDEQGLGDREIAERWMRQEGCAGLPRTRRQRQHAEEGRESDRYQAYKELTERRATLRQREAARKAVNRERLAPLKGLRRLVEPEARAAGLDLQVA